jgi:hypothetical protein
MTGIAADSTYDVGSEVALLRTVIFTMSNLTAYQTLSSVETVVVGVLQFWQAWFSSSRSVPFRAASSRSWLRFSSF